MRAIKGCGSFPSSVSFYILQPHSAVVQRHMKTTVTYYEKHVSSLRIRAVFLSIVTMQKMHGFAKLGLYFNIEI